MTHDESHSPLSLAAPSTGPRLGIFSSDPRGCSETPPPGPRGPFDNLQAMDGLVMCGRCEQTLPPDYDTTRPLPWLCMMCEDQLQRLEAAGQDEPSLNPRADG